MDKSALSTRDTIWHSLRFGWTFGLLLGLLDAVIRISRQLFEWYEIYLCLLFPALTCSFILGAVSVIFCFFPSIKKSKENLTRSLIISLCIFILVLFSSVQLKGDLLVEKVIEELVVAVVLLISLIVFVCRVPTKWLSLWKEHTSLFRFFFTFFIITCFIFDIWQLKVWPNSLSKKTSLLSTEHYPPIILLSLDTVRAQNLKIYGYNQETMPHLTNFSQQSVIFDAAYASSSWTLPSHASIFTGKFIHEHGANTLSQQLRTEFETLAEILQNKGYRTGGFIGGPYAKARYGFAQGFEIYRDRLDFFEWHTLYENFSLRHFLAKVAPELVKSLFNTDGERLAPEILQDVERFLDKVGDQPFFLFINLFDAHSPYTLGSDYHQNFLQSQADITKLHSLVTAQYTDENMRFSKLEYSTELKEQLEGLYNSELYYLDTYLNTFFSELRKRELFDKSIIIITGDHGEEFFEHGGLQHRQTLYEEVVHVPLLIRSPNMPQDVLGSRISTRVNNQRIFHTILSELNIDDSKNLGLDCYWTERELCSDLTVVAELYGNRRFGPIDQFAIWSGDWKLISNTQTRGRIESGLFNLDEDKGEQNNLLYQENLKAKELQKLLPLQLQKYLVGANQNSYE